MAQPEFVSRQISSTLLEDQVEKKNDAKNLKSMSPFSHPKRQGVKFNSNLTMEVENE
nr:hypothetical protein [uncultured Desulfobacter sp.]